MQYFLSIGLHEGLSFQATVQGNPPVSQKEHSALQNLKLLNPIRIQRPNWIRKTARNYSIHHSNNCSHTVLFALLCSDEICSGGAMSNTTMCPICDGCNSWRLNETCAVSKVHRCVSVSEPYSFCPDPGLFCNNCVCTGRVPDPTSLFLPTSFCM